jgi:YhcH/YjgK/YiaL family protein
MVIDKIENIKKYKGLGQGIYLALEHLRDTDFRSKETGKYELIGSNSIVNIYDYQTRENDKQFEAHRKNIDVQFVVSGSELMGYVPLNGQTPSVEYKEEEDYALYNLDGSFFAFNEGMFAVLYPEDLHMPGVGASGNHVRKVVVKVRV